MTLGEALITNAPEERERIGALLYLHFEDRAVAHTFRVASGLDSMAVGESQIRAQLRESLREAQSVRRAGPALNALFQQALRVGKRVHTETDLDSVGVSLVDAGYARAAASLGTLAHLHVLVIGAGAMASLAATTAARSGARQVSVVNRTHARGAPPEKSPLVNPACPSCAGCSANCGSGLPTILEVMT